MSIRLGMIISKSISKHNLEHLRTKFGLSLIEIYNPHLSKLLLEDEIILQISENGDDSLTGIGAIEYYNKDVEKLCNTIKIDNLTKVNIIDEFNQRKVHYKNDIIKWIEILKYMYNELHVEKIGLFYYNALLKFDDENIIINGQATCKIKDLSFEYLLEMNPNVFYYFY